MLAGRRRKLIYAIEFFDLLVLVFCLFIAASFESKIQHINFEHFLSMRVTVKNVLLLIGLGFVWQVIFKIFGVYASQRLMFPDSNLGGFTRKFEIYSSGRSSVLSNDVADIIIAVSVGTLFIGAMGKLFHLNSVNGFFLTVFWSTNCMVTIVSRLIIKGALRQLRVHGRDPRIIVIVGNNARSVHFAKRLVSHNEFDYKINGFVDDESPHRQAAQHSGFSIVCGIKDFPSYLRKNAVDEVMICLPIKSFYQEISDIIAHCEEQGCVVRFNPDLFNRKMSSAKVITHDGESIVTIATGKMEGAALLIKRAVDIFVSFAMIIMLLPLFIVVAILIKITSQGPVLFIQERLGLNKRRIGVIKFRTMELNAEKKLASLEGINEMDGPVFKIKEDPRITKIGKFLRKMSIDELPQLFNVLKGDMSLVGPRPFSVRDFEGFNRDWHRRRFSVRPGITCLWQVSGRSNISFDRWMELDMEYIDNWSLWLDLKILFWTIPAVVTGHGAS